MTDVRLGVLLWNQATDWPAYEDAARRVDQLGYDHLWAWDHLYAIFGDPLQPIFEGWMSLAAWAKATEHVRLGLLVGANTFRNPGLTAKLATTLDHLSNGRRSWASAAPGSTRSTTPMASSSAAGSASAWTGWTRRRPPCARCSTAAP